MGQEWSRSEMQLALLQYVMESSDDSLADVLSQYVGVELEDIGQDEDQRWVGRDSVDCFVDDGPALLKWLEHMRGVCVALNSKVNA